MKELPIRFYDCPGIDEEEDRTMTLDVLEAVIKGHVKPDSKVLHLVLLLENTCKTHK